MNKPQYIIVHHTGGTDANPLADSSGATFGDIAELHRKNYNFPSSLGYYIGYHYFIEKSGKVTQGRKDTDIGAHTVGYNDRSIGVCLAGNFDATLPTASQEASLKTLLLQLCDKYAVPYKNIVPHRTFAKKSCYGKRLSDNWAQALAINSKITQLWNLVLSLRGKLFRKSA